LGGAPFKFALFDRNSDLSKKKKEEVQPLDNLLSLKIKQIQTDDGHFSPIHNFYFILFYFSQHGILNQITCSYTSQQNGIAEREHKHIIETSLAFFPNLIFLPNFGWKLLIGLFT
jgi:hypothetical protein